MKRLSKIEAAKFLKVSLRTVERYSQKGKLHPIYENGENGPEAYYVIDELQKLKDDTEIETHKSEIVSEVVTDDDGAIASVTPVLLITQDIVSKLAEVVASFQHTQVSPLAIYRELEEAAEKGWVLPTTQIKQLIGVTLSGKGITRGSFNFIRSGKIGREAGWKVERVERALRY